MQTFQRVLIGTISGIVATGPMTIAMILMHRRLPASQRYPLPPREITMKLAKDAGVAHAMDPETRSAATLLGHFGYGAAAGALYGGAFQPLRAPVSKGLLFGLFVWTASYLGWLPAAGILSPATEHPARRNLLMILAHFVWGTALSGLAYLLTSEAEEQAGVEPFSTVETPLHDAR